MFCFWIQTWKNLSHFLWREAARSTTGEIRGKNRSTYQSATSEEERAWFWVYSVTKELALEFITTRMNSNDYQQVLGTHLLRFMQRNSSFYKKGIAAIHVSNSTMSWFRANQVELLDWPACSTDMSLMKNVWGILVRQIYANGKQYQHQTQPSRQILNSVAIYKLLGQTVYSM